MIDTTADIRGKRYRVRTARLIKNWGECDHPATPGKEIRISRELSGFALLETIIHEQLHAALWDLNEDAIEETSHAVARLLWRLGYRSPDVMTTSHR